jgi:ppGpp synthetase/RelA/SpoT-type nucleotidyltranferase
VTEKDIDIWIDKNRPIYKSFTRALIPFIGNMLKDKNITYSSVGGRTKETQSIKNKIISKRYNSPYYEMMDITGIRIISLFESDLSSIRNFVKSEFKIDEQNSVEKSKQLQDNKVGYLSEHFICSISEGNAKSSGLDEYIGKKFEIQVRTILQHAWAEFDHDRNYKSSVQLHESIRREINLYAGMLEIVDKGFTQLTSKIEKDIKEKSKLRFVKGWTCGPIDTNELIEFITQWAKENNFKLKKPFLDEYEASGFPLLEFGVYTIDSLQSIIPPHYAEIASLHSYTTDVDGLIRDWMIIKDYKNYTNNVTNEWPGFKKDNTIFGKFLSDKEVAEIYQIFI